MNAIRNDRHYTYADYMTWGEDVRCEIIDGVVYDMAPGPSAGHQTISGEIYSQIKNSLKGTPCKVFFAPFDVRLGGLGDEDDTVVQPDLVVVSDKSKIDEKGCNGAPDIIVEVLSPSTSSRDKFLKFQLYLRAGVREYWVVDPVDKIVSAYVLRDGEYIASAYGENDTAPVRTLSGCSIILADVFNETD